MNNRTDEPAVLVSVSRATLSQLPADVSLEECVALWSALENPGEIVDGEGGEKR